VEILKIHSVTLIFITFTGHASVNCPLYNEPKIPPRIQIRKIYIPHALTRAKSPYLTPNPPTTLHSNPSTNECSMNNTCKLSQIFPPRFQIVGLSLPIFPGPLESLVFNIVRLQISPPSLSSPISILLRFPPPPSPPFPRFPMLPFHSFSLLRCLAHQTHKKLTAPKFLCQAFPRPPIRI